MKLVNVNDYEYLSEFLKAHKNNFPIDLGNKVDILVYAEKLIKIGKVIGIEINNTLEGVIGGYCNDNETKQAYISILIIDSSYRGLGYSKKLLSRFIDICQENDMKNILVYTNCNNKEARGLYVRSGFIECGKANDEIKFIKGL